MGQVAVCLLQGEWITTCWVLSTRSRCLCTEFPALKETYAGFVPTRRPSLRLSLSVAKSRDTAAAQMSWNGTFLWGAIVCLWIMWGRQTRREQEGRRRGKLSILSRLSAWGGWWEKVWGPVGMEGFLENSDEKTNASPCSNSRPTPSPLVFPELLGSTKRLNINYQDSEG